MFRHFSTRLLVFPLMLGIACSRDVTLEERAQQGAADAQCDLGVKYFKGDGVSKDFNQALMWFRKAADQGYARAEDDLGLMYGNGEGVAKDFAEAVKWCRKAADQGYAPAQVRIGKAYVSGDGVTKDSYEAVKWFRKAADQGNAQAEDHLGMMYAAGEGIAKDGAEATKWYRKATEQGFADAQDRLGVAYAAGYGVPKDYAEASKWFRKAADQGYAKAQTDLGVLYANGMGVAKDCGEALKWYQKAADQGNTKALSEVNRLQRELAEQSRVAPTLSPTEEASDYATSGALLAKQESKEQPTPEVVSGLSSIAGIYEYSKPSGAYDSSGIPIKAKFSLELRSDGSFIFTKDTGMPSYMPNGLGNSRSTGTWETSTSDVVLFAGGKEEKLRIEGTDLINPDGTRFFRTR